MFLLIAGLSLAALLAIWVAYPVIVAGLALMRRERGPARTGPLPRSLPRSLPRVSIVIATRDDPAAVKGRVADCLAADYDADLLDVVVALDVGNAGASPDDLGRLDPRVVVVLGDAPGGKAPTLNAGVRAAPGDVLVFTDTHQRFGAGAVRYLAEALDADRVGAASGSLELVRATGRRSLVEYYWLYERWLRRCEGRLHSAVGVTGAVYAMRRSLWTPLPPGLLLDDLYVPMQVVLRGYRVGFDERAKALDSRRTDARQEYRRKVRTLTGVVQLCAWLPATLVPLRNPIWAQFVCHKLLRLLTPYLILGVVGGGAGALLGYLGRELSKGGVVVAAGMLVLLALLAARRSRLRDTVAWTVALQAATVVALFNGLRGRWDVWQK